MRDSKRRYFIAIVKWLPSDGLSQAFAMELLKLGHNVQPFMFDENVPLDADIVFSFAPYGRFAQIPRQLSQEASGFRPMLIHWHMESYPDPHIPWILTRFIGRLRSAIDRMVDAQEPWKRHCTQLAPLGWINQRLHKFRYVGDYDYAFRQGVLDLLVDSSLLYHRLHQRLGYPTIRVPWGTMSEWYKDLNLERDIDVLWMGSRRTWRRGRLLDNLKRELGKEGISFFVADNQENPFLYGEKRTEYLNRAKITLNILPTYYDTNFPYRFHLAAPNRSLVISEPLIAHYPDYIPGEHYVVATSDNLVPTIVYYLNHPEERLQIVDNAYILAACQLTMQNSLRTILDRASEFMQGRTSGWR